MFVRPSWRPRTDEELYSFIEAHPWALLVSNGADGPYATNLPLLLDRNRGENGTLVGHIARANAHAKVVAAADTPGLAIFQGPYSFVSGSWYPNRDMPSTYYYTSIHCYGRIRIQAERELEHWIEVLTNRMESAYPNGWKLSDVPRQDITRRLPAIMGFELEISRIEGKFKLGQDEPKKDAMAVCRILETSAKPSDVELAKLIRAYNSDREEK
jgi:transcriptional regulator